MMDGGDHLRQGSVDLPKTLGQKDEGWGPPPRQRHCTSGPFDLSTGSPAHAVAPPADPLISGPDSRHGQSSELH